MGLNKVQLDLLAELKSQSDAFERYRNGLPYGIVSLWSKLVGHMREYYYLDETWDGKELTFHSNEKSSVAFIGMTLEPDKIIISFKDEKSTITLMATDSDEDTIIKIKTINLPERVIPNKNIVLSSGKGRCDLCLHSTINLSKQDRRVDMSMGFAKCFGYAYDMTSSECSGSCKDCRIDDIGLGTPGMTADEVTHILFPYWWTKSKRFLEQN